MVRKIKIEKPVEKELLTLPLKDFIYYNVCDVLVIPEEYFDENGQLHINYTQEEVDFIDTHGVVLEIDGEEKLFVGALNLLFSKETGVEFVEVEDEK